MNPGDRDKLGRRFNIKPKKCRKCGGEFQPSSGFQKFCSPNCQRQGELEPRKCKHCGETFIKARHAPTQYCCQSCATKANIARKGLDPLPKHRICPVCKGSFTPERRRQECCSHSCATTLAHERRRKTLGSLPPWGCKSKGEKMCRCCGIRPATHLHHIVPRSICPKQGRRDLRNGLPLCTACHMGWHSKEIIVFKDCLRPEERAFAIELKSERWVDSRYPPRPYEIDKLDELSIEEQTEIVDLTGGIGQALGLGAVK